LAVFVSLACGGTSIAQDAAPSPPASGPVRVFIDCNNTPCDGEFFRTEINFVEHVRDRQTADIHLLMTGQSTGSGGREITFSFFGQGRFVGQDRVLKETFVVASSEDAVRRGMVRVMSLGLVPYVLGTAGADRLRLTVEAAPATTPGSALQSHDPWNRWSFRVNLNGNANGESSSKSYYVNTNVNANRTTDNTKINVSGSMNYRESKFDLPDGRTFRSPNRDYGTNGLFVKSIGNHWSAGARANWSSSTYNNQDWSFAAGPGIEWDLFPYSESTRRILAVNYSVRHRVWDYREVTIYGKLRETRMSQSLETNLSMRQRWGTLSGSVDIQSFVPGFREESPGDVRRSVTEPAARVVAELGSNFEWVRDQISLPAEEVTTEGGARQPAAAGDELPVLRVLRGQLHIRIDLQSDCEPAFQLRGRCRRGQLIVATFN
jgi:hypothetical protein